MRPTNLLIGGVLRRQNRIGFVQSIRPEYLYIADLDRIEGTGSHDAVIQKCAKNVRCCYVDRGCQSPSDVLAGENIVNIVGTETGGSDLSRYHGGFLSIDVKQGLVIPSGKDPVEVLTSAQHWDFEGCILLDVSAVGTEKGIDGHGAGKTPQGIRWKAHVRGRCCILCRSRNDQRIRI